MKANATGIVGQNPAGNAWDVWNPNKNNGRTAISTGVGLLNHQQYVEIKFDPTIQKTEDIIFRFSWQTGCSDVFFIRVDIFSRDFPRLPYQTGYRVTGLPVTCLDLHRGKDECWQWPSWFCLCNSPKGWATNQPLTVSMGNLRVHPPNATPPQEIISLRGDEMWWIRGETPIAIIMRYQLMLISDWNLRNGWILVEWKISELFFGGVDFLKFWDLNGSMWLIPVFLILLWFFSCQSAPCFFSTQLLRCFISFFLTHWWILIAFFIVDGQNPAWSK